MEMSLIIQITLFIVGWLIGSCLLRLAGAISRVFTVSAVNKAKYLAALVELAKRAEKMSDRIDNELGDNLKITLSDLFSKDRTSAQDLVFLYSLISAIKKDKDRVSRKILFLENPVSVFYQVYGKAVKDIPELQEPAD